MIKSEASLSLSLSPGVYFNKMTKLNKYCVRLSHKAIPYQFGPTFML